jgi:hypothetical protein
MSRTIKTVTGEVYSGCRGNFYEEGEYIIKKFFGGRTKIPKALVVEDSERSPAVDFLAAVAGALAGENESEDHELITEQDYSEELDSLSESKCSEIKGFMKGFSFAMSMWEAHDALDEDQQFFSIEDQARRREVFNNCKEIFLGSFERRLRQNYKIVNSRWPQLDLRVEDDDLHTFEEGVEGAFTIASQSSGEEP